MRSSQAYITLPRWSDRSDIVPPPSSAPVSTKFGARAAGCVAHHHLRRLRIGGRRHAAAPHGRVPDVLDDLLAVHEAGPLQPVPQERDAALRLLPGLRPGVAELDLTDEAGAVAH